MKSASRLARTLRCLRRSTSGVAATEFALIIPFLLGAGLTGLEVGNRVMVQMQIGQLAVHIADNASRIGDTSTLQDRRIYESDINDVFAGAETQAGRGIDLFAHGRVIISSQEVVPGTEDDQYIHWQRCMGAKPHESSYGEEDDGRSGSFPGMGRPGQEVYAFADEAVIFVEIAYDYQPIFNLPFGLEAEIISTAAYSVRDDRDLSQIYQRNSGVPDDVADCTQFGGSSYSNNSGSSGSTSGSGSSSSSSTTSSTSSTSGGTTSSSSSTSSTSGGRGGKGGKGGKPRK